MTGSTRFRQPRLFIAFIPLLLGISLLIIFLNFPFFYERFLFSQLWREMQMIEILTFLTALSAGMILVRQGYRLLTCSGLTGGKGIVSWGWQRTGALLISLIGLAALFFAGEEINWGQTLYRWGMAQKAMWMEHGAVSLHNRVDLPIKIQVLGLIFFFNGFVILPVLWRHRVRLRLPSSLQPAVPHAESIIAAVSSLLWERSLFSSHLVTSFASTITGHDLNASIRYGSVLDQLDEQRELMVAVTIFIYAINCIRTVRNYLQGDAVNQDGGQNTAVSAE